MSTPLDKLGDLFDPPAKVPAPKPPKVSQPHGAYDALTEGRWAIGDAPKVKDWYKQTYGRDLPVTAAGQSGTHNRMGLDHSDSLDVGLNPATDEGRALTTYLRQNNIPFLAYDRAVPGAATNAHVHIGYPSHGGQGGQAAKLGALGDLFDPPEPSFAGAQPDGTWSSPATPLPSQATPPQSPEAGATLHAISQAQPAPAGTTPPPPVIYPAEGNADPSRMTREQIEAYQRELESRRGGAAGRQAVTDTLTTPPPPVPDSPRNIFTFGGQPPPAKPNIAADFEVASPTLTPRRLAVEMPSTPNRQRDPLAPSAQARPVKPNIAADVEGAPDPLAGQDAQEGEEVVRGPVGLPTNPRGFAKASDVSGEEFQDGVYKVSVLRDDTPQTVMHRFVTQAADAANLPEDLKAQFLDRMYQGILDGRVSLADPPGGLTAEQKVEQAKRAGALPIQSPVMAEALLSFQRMADERARRMLAGEIAAGGAGAVSGADRDVYGRTRGGATEQELRQAGRETAELDLARQGGGTLRGEAMRRGRVGALWTGAVSGDPLAAGELGGRYAAEVGRKGISGAASAVGQGSAVIEEGMERVGLPVFSRYLEGAVARLYSGVTGREFVPGKYAGERLSYRLAQAVQDSLGEDKDLAPEFSFKVAGAVGSSLPFIVGSILSGGGPAVAGILGALQEAGSTYQTLSEKGVTGDRRLGYSLAGGAVGFSEMFGLGGAFNRATGGTFTRSFARWLLASGREASEEAIQEFFQTAAGQAVIARAAKEDPNWPRILSDAFESAKVAAVTGGVVGGGMHAAAGGASEQTLAPKPAAPQTQAPSVAPVAVPEAVTPQPVQVPAVAPGSQVRVVAGQMEGETGTVAEVENGVALVRLSGGGETRISVSRVEPVAVETPVAPAQDDDGALPPPPVPTAEDERLAREEAEYVRGGERYSQPLPQAPEVVTPAEAAPQHHSQFQPRRQRGDGKGQFKPGRPKIPEVASETAEDTQAAMADIHEPGGLEPKRAQEVAPQTRPGVEAGTGDVGRDGGALRPAGDTRGEGQGQSVRPPQPARLSEDAAPDRLNAPVPDSRAFREQMKTTFRLSDEQADAVTAIVEARAGAWGRENGRDPSDYYVERFGGVVKGGESASGALNQAAGNAPTFYSQAQRVVEGIRQERMQPRQLAAMLEKGGVKAEEMRWTGLDDFLRERAAKNQAVTKSEALEFLRQNEVRVEEVEKGGAKEFTVRYDKRNKEYDVVPLVNGKAQGKVRGSFDNEDDALALAFQLGRSENTPTKFSQYTLPGAKEGSYRELLLTLPPKNEGIPADAKLTTQKWTTSDGVERTAYTVHSETMGGLGGGMTPEEAWALARKNAAYLHQEKAYKSSHYGEPNILAHVRFNERTDASGKRVLFVEEIQSDWHQAGRKRGYKGTGNDARVEELHRLFNDWQREHPNTSSAEYRTAYPERAREAQELTVASNSNAVPDAPFKKNWQELAFKRILRHAAENGYDRVAWTTGDTQAARYDLSKQVEQINFRTSERGAREVVITPKGGSQIELTVDPQNGKVTASSAAEAKGKTLDEVVGKEIAEKILAERWGDLTGVDLKVGGEGMKGFYDKILPAFAAKYGRKWGAPVGETEFAAKVHEVKEGENELEVVDESGRVIATTDYDSEAYRIARENPGSTVRGKGVTKGVVYAAHFIDITPEMRRSVLSEGQPLFQENKAAVEFMRDGRAVLRAFKQADVSSAAHELAHVFRRDLSPDLLRDAEEAIGVKGGNWTNPDEERFARGFERYLKTGEAPSVKLRRVFDAFKNWLTAIYGAIRGKNHPLNYKPNPQLVAVFDRMLGGQPKGQYGQLINALYKAPSEGTPAFFENAQVKRTLGLRPDATTADVRAALTEAVGKPRSSHLSPEDVKAWADSKNLRGAAREALDFAVGKYAETVKTPTAYQQTGIRRRNVDPTTQSLAEFVRAAGGIRVDRDGANRGELEALTNKESGSTGLVRKDGVSVYEMARMAAEAGYPVATGGGYYTDEGMMRRAAGSEEPDADALLEALARDLGGERVYSHQREIDYEELYRKENPDESADALISLIETERGGILFDKVQDGSATRREITEFRQLAADGGVYPDHVAAILRDAKEAQASGGLQDSAGRKPEEDFDFRDDPLDAEPILFQRSHPRQLGFVQEGLTQESARPRELSGYDKSQAKDEPLRRTLGDESFGKLRGLQESPVARLAVEVERRVRASNAQNAPDVLVALSKLAELKRQKQTVDDYLNQGSLFGGRELTPAQERILSALDRNPRKVIEEAFPEEARPEQNVLFQSDHTQAARRQRAYRALLEAKGQGTLTPDMRAREKPTLKEHLVDVANVPKTLKSSLDLSAAGRQGLKFVTSHPVQATRVFFGDQMRSLSNKGYEGFKDRLKADPRFKQMQDSGLFLASAADANRLTEREEAFASKLAGKVPLVARSEHAYLAFLDAARVKWFTQLARAAEEQATKTQKPVSADQYKAIAEFVNIATGRGNLGKGSIEKMGPVLNALLFSPRYMASKVQFLDPRVYTRMPQGARGTAVRQAVQHYALLAGVIALAKAGAPFLGWGVATDDPAEADFGKIRVGNTRYDISAGELSYVNLMARLFKHFEGGGKKDETALKLVDRWLRYKYAPIPAAIRNLDEGKNAVGEKATLGREVYQAFAPMLIDDLYEAWQQEGGRGLLKNAPGFVGVGVNTYTEKNTGGGITVPPPRVPKPKVPAPRLTK